MSRTSLQNWLLANKTFRLAFNQLEVAAVRAQFPKLEPLKSAYDRPNDWPYLLFCASILAPSTLADAEEKALRIAQSALLAPDCLPAERDAALVILDTLSNRRSIQLAEERAHVAPDIAARLGTLQSIDWTRRTLENSIALPNGKELDANKFQRRFWNATKDAQWLSVSAPTSAGKSFILAQWLAGGFASGHFSKLIYIAPTRALLQQVETDLRAALADCGADDVDVRTMPMRGEDKIPTREIFVFTQERLHYFIQRYGTPAIDALIIDEAHKVGDSNRGILLQDVIEQITAASPDAKVMFTSPLSENPETLLADCPDGASRAAIDSNDVMVNQNLLWLEREPGKPRLWQLGLRRGDATTPLGHFSAAGTLRQKRARLAELAILSDAGEGGILVYANGAAEAEEIAEKIAARIEPVGTSKFLADLEDLAKTTIHKKYRLRKVLPKGVAFHYGNMPLILRTAIEEGFRRGDIRYLVCTSTLVEGVNLPCRNILVFAPKKGKLPMTAADFWNLAGRAGRWGKEFQGNVICVDTDDIGRWGPSLPRSRRRYRIERTTDRLLADETELVTYIAEGAPTVRAKTEQDLETAVSYFASVRQKHGTLREAPWRDRVNPTRLARIDDILAEKLSALDLPAHWIGRHAGISPFAMSRMMTKLGAIEGPITPFLPIDPEEPEAWKQYGRIFEMMGHHMTATFGDGARCQALGILTTDWMLGQPINRIISSRIDWVRKKGRSEKVATSIRKTLEDIEQIARFQAPRYLACYGDIVGELLLRRGENSIAASLPDLTLSLEFGVRGPVQLELMALGLSRSATLAVSEAISNLLTDDEIDRVRAEPELVAVALGQLKPLELNLPTLVLDEISRLQEVMTRPVPVRPRSET